MMKEEDDDDGTDEKIREPRLKPAQEKHTLAAPIWTGERESCAPSGRLMKKNHHDDHVHHRDTTHFGLRPHGVLIAPHVSVCMFEYACVPDPVFIMAKS